MTTTPPRRITADHIRALAAPPMANGVHRTVLLWADGQAVCTDPDSVFSTGGRLVCSRADLLDADCTERPDGSLGGPVARTAAVLAESVNRDLHEALSLPDTAEVAVQGTSPNTPCTLF